MCSHFVHSFLVHVKTALRNGWIVTQITFEWFGYLMLWVGFQLVVFQLIPLGEFFFTILALMTEIGNVRLNMPPEVELWPVKGGLGVKTWMERILKTFLCIHIAGSARSRLLFAQTVHQFSPPAPCFDHPPVSQQSIQSFPNKTRMHSSSHKNDELLCIKNKKSYQGPGIQTSS